MGDNTNDVTFQEEQTFQGTFISFASVKHMDKPSIYLGDSENGSDVIISGNTSSDQFAQALGDH